MLLHLWTRAATASLAVAGLRYAHAHYVTLRSCESSFSI